MSNNAKNANENVVDALESSLGEVLGVDSAQYAAVPLSQISLSPNLTDILEEAGLKTLEDVLRSSRLDLLTIPRVGIIGANELEQAVRAYTGTEPTTGSQESSQLSAPTAPLGGIIKEGVERDTETGYILPPDRRSLEFDRPLANLFDTDERDFAEVPLEVLDLRSRSYNCLSNAGCETVEDLLDLTTRELASIRSMGEGSLRDVFYKTQSYIASAPSSRLVVQQIDLDESPAFQAAIEALMEGRDINLAQLSEELSSVFSDYEKAVEAVGKDVCLALYTDSQYGSRIVEILTELGIMWARWDESLEQARELMEKIPGKVRQGRAFPFIEAFEAQNGSLGPFGEQVGPDLLVKSLLDVAESLKKKGEDPLYARKLNEFLTWLDFDMPSLFQSTIEAACASRQDGGKRSLEVIAMRSEHKTLEEIGRMYGITRERVRQIENTARNRIWRTRQMIEHDLILSAYAMLGGQAILRVEDIIGMIGPQASFLWSCVRADQKPQLHAYCYVPELDIIAVKLGELKDWSTQQVQVQAERMEDLFPDMLTEGERQQAIDAAVRSTGLPLSVALEAFARAYNKDGPVYYRHKDHLNRTDMIAYVLREFYPNGYRLGHDTLGFQDHLRDVFGDRAAADVSQRAIDLKVEDVGVMCASETFVDPDFLNVDAKAAKAVNDYIEKASRDMVSYEEILKVLGKKLKESGITNKFVLQGALKKYGFAYSMSRNYIRKTPSTTLADAVEAFVEQHGTVTRSQVAMTFPTLSTIWLMTILQRRPNILNVDEDHCVHSSTVDIEPEDYTQIGEYLDAQTAQGAVHIDAVYRDLSERKAPILSRNSIDSKNMLFEVLRYMFSEKYAFSRPYIASAGQNDISHKSAILDHLDKMGDVHSIPIDDLLVILNEYGIRYVSAGMVSRLLAPEFVRMDKTTLMRRDAAGITDEIAQEAVSTVKQWVDEEGYLVSARAPKQIHLPDFGGEWTDFLLDSVMVGVPDIYEIRAPRNPSNHSNLIYVAQIYKDDTFDSFVRQLLDKKRAQVPISREEAAIWIRGKGIVDGQLPQIFNNEEYWSEDKEQQE